MKLTVPLLSQRDSRWASQRLGTQDGATIGGYGCILTCVCMLANYYKHPITPDQMDNWLTDNQGYIDASGLFYSPAPGCDLYLNTALNREFSDCSFDHAVFCATTPAPLSEIDWFLQHGFPVVVEVDFDHDPTDGIQTHFVLVVGKTDDGHYIINDPWTGEEYFFDAKYGDPSTAILQVNYFVGPAQMSIPAPIPAPIVPSIVKMPDTASVVTPTASQSTITWPEAPKTPVTPEVATIPSYNMIEAFLHWLYAKLIGF